MSFIPDIIKNNIQNIILLSILSIFFLLLLRSPYSTRTLIPNLEPFPDALYYTTTPRCFLNRQSWKMCRLKNTSMTGINAVVPPAYSGTLLLGYLINSDVRTFYFVNILLSLISLTLLYKIANNFFKNKYIVGIILFLYITNYFTYWYPTLAMAENLLIPIFLLSILILQQKTTNIKLSILTGITAASFYATKYAFAPLTLTFPIFYLIKILKDRRTNKNKFKQILFAAIPGGIILLNLVGIPQLIDTLNQILNGAIKSNSSNAVTSGGSYFSISYFYKHFKAYSNALIGKPQRFLWDNTPLVAKWISLPSLLGLLAVIKRNKYNLTKIYLIFAIVAQLLFISTFYVVDIRYVYHFLPILLLGFGFFLQLLHKTILKSKINFNTFLAMIFIIYLGSNAMRLKSAIMVNIKYAETPWWYLSQLEMNNYFDNLEIAKNYKNKPILITLASPFLTDDYSNQNYNTLPLDNQQDFRNNMNEVWGKNNYEDLTKLYKQKIIDNNNVYITNYGVSATGHFKQSYKTIENNFDLKQVHSGCYNLCNIYKLKIKNQQSLSTTRDN